MRTLKQITNALSKAVESLHFSEPIAHVYNPLAYAKRPHAQYIERFGQPTKTVVLVGMNPGPFGMMQTGIPFGDVTMVKEFLQIEAPIDTPEDQHLKRPIAGFSCTRSEVSGSRLWGFVKDRFGDPDTFFKTFYVANYCPLVFLEAGGRNRTPDKLQPYEKRKLFEICDKALLETVQFLGARTVIGIGAFAFARVTQALKTMPVATGTILHPSPASPAANRGWAEQAEQQLHALGLL